jgi:NAD+ diphosphatase
MIATPSALGTTDTEIEGNEPSDPLSRVGSHRDGFHASRELLTQLTTLELPTLHYTGGRLDRVAKLRNDEDWVSAAFVGDDAQTVLICNDQNLVAGPANGEDGARAAMVPLAIIRDRLQSDAFTWVLLGLDGSTPVFAVDLPATTLSLVPEIHEAGEFVDIRRVGALVPPADAALLAYARAILGWHRRHRYCGTCGGPTESRQAGHLRRCRSAECAADNFPRTDPVVIALVTRRREHDGVMRCLLGRHARLPRGVYSLLAGFVEPGESPEEAVAREVREEAGIEVTDVRYAATQPWPFPYSLMMGFQATALRDDIVLDGDELEDAQWFTAAEVATFGEWDDESASYRLPRRDSIARVLLDAWVAELGSES